MKKCVFLLFLFVLFGIRESGFLEEALALDPQLKANAHDIEEIEEKRKLYTSTGVAQEFVDDFESYENQELINGKPNWVSSDDYYSKGWSVEGETFKYIHFHPSPWPGGFQLDSNYAIYHIHSQTKIDSLFLEVRYMIMRESEMKIFISGDNKNWVDVTENIGMHRSGGEWKVASGDLSSSLTSANILKDIYVKFSGAAYSGSWWGVGIDKVKVKVNIARISVSKEQITSVGNLTIVSFKPEKEESVLDGQVKNVARKLLEITSKKAIKEAINSLAGKIASKAFGFVTAVISQMPSVGNPTDIDCYFMAEGDLTKRAEINLGESVGILAYISPGDLLQDLIIELKRDSEVVYSERIPYSLFQERYGYISLITTSQPLSLNEQGEYHLTVIYGGPKSTASLRIR